MSDPPSIASPRVDFHSIATEDALQDFDGYIHGAVRGFVEKYFPALSCPDENQRLANAFQELIANDEDRNTLMSQFGAENLLDVFPKLSALKKERSHIGAEWHTCHSQESGTNIESEALIFLYQPPAFHDATIVPHWRYVQIVGIFHRNTSDIKYRDGLNRLCASARQVFDSQPERLFLHSFYIRGTLVELWVFDRSGMYSSEVFDYRDNVGQFIRILIGYQCMSETELGKNKLFSEDKHGCHIQREDAGLGQARTLLLENQPIAISDEVIGNGTTCYRAKAPTASSWEHVVKFKWRLAARDRPEEEMLKLIREKNVWGVISLDWCTQAATTASLRQGIQCGRYRKFLCEPVESKQSGAVVGFEGILSHTEETNIAFEDRVATCIVVSPPGRPLNTFKSALELLQVLRDVIKGHRSLLEDANVLHQDVSPGNIIITDDKSETQPRGILIDFDVAMDLAVGPRTPGEVTGTRPFMAIGILLGRRHWYRHDLESFLYVFLWTVITNGSESPSSDSKLRKWSRGSWDDLAAQKTSDMGKDGFQAILAEFPIQFDFLKPLAEHLRQLLFPIVDDAIWTGVDNDPDVRNRIYDGFIGAFEETIAGIIRK